MGKFYVNFTYLIVYLLRKNRAAHIKSNLRRKSVSMPMELKRRLSAPIIVSAVSSIVRKTLHTTATLLQDGLQGLENVVWSTAFTYSQP
jgi:hypothetical protein